MMQCRYLSCISRLNHERWPFEDALRTSSRTTLLSETQQYDLMPLEQTFKVQCQRKWYRPGPGGSFKMLLEVVSNLFHHVDVSKNRGTPKSSILIGFSLINHPFGGFPPIFGSTPMSSPWFLAIQSLWLVTQDLLSRSPRSVLEQLLAKSSLGVSETSQRNLDVIFGDSF